MIPRKLPSKKHIPYYKQEKTFTCGPAVLRMALAGLGKKMSERQLEKAAGTTSSKGTPNLHMTKCLKKLGVAHMMGYKMRYHDLMHYTKQGITIIDWMPQLLFPDHPEFKRSHLFNPSEDSHYAIVISAGAKWVVLQDPVLGRRLRLLRKDFVHAWRDPILDADRWMLAILPRTL